ncbi:MAG: DUF1570 domain-containing protein [Planctomycetaceae bacterium]|nr:DUF1570 domain-containing protein [Planctomycetaceae bacterium]
MLRSFVPRALCLLAAAPLLLAHPNPGALRSAAPAADSDGGPPSTDDVRSALESESPLKALEVANLALEFRPEDPELFGLAAEAAEKAGEIDQAMQLVVAALELDHLTAAERKAFQGQLALLDPNPGAIQALVDAYAAEQLELAKGFERRKLYANAVELLLRCEGSASEDAARKLLDKIYGNEKAVEELLQSGVDVPIEPPKSKKTPEWIAKEDAKRARWENAYEIKSDNYTIRTNMGYEMAHAMSQAMEQMGEFYRRVFRYKERGGTMRRCVINVYAQRREFDEYEGITQPTIRGFFVPLENRVAAYDRRTDDGTLADLWSTLFHEASHQFTSAVAKSLIPGWLNEGTASYFEGARLTSNGKVQTNLIPDGRLRQLAAMLGSATATTASTSGVKLLDVISYFRPGSYDGAFYPWGWGLVYFFHNFENEKSERIYLQPYFDFWQAYAGGAKHEVVDRFVEYFVTQPAVPGIENFANFEVQFANWIRELNTLHFGGPEQADKLIAKGRKQTKNGKHAYAAESFQWALRKRVDDVSALYGLGVAFAELEQSDGAVYYLRRALDFLRNSEDPDAELAHFDGLKLSEAAADAEQRIRKIEATVTSNADASADAFAKRSAALAEQYTTAEYPRAALLAIERSLGLLGSSLALEKLAQEIRQDGALDNRRWRRLPLGGDLEAWEKSPGGRWEAENWKLKADKRTGGPGFLIAPTTVASRWRFESGVSIAAGASASYQGLVFGAGAGGGQQLLGLSADGNVVLVRFEDNVPDVDRIGSFMPMEDAVYKVTLEARHSELEVFVDDESIAVIPMSPEDLTGRVGFFLQGARSVFEGARVLH